MRGRGGGLCGRVREKRKRKRSEKARGTDGPFKRRAGERGKARALLFFWAAGGGEGGKMWEEVLLGAGAASERPARPARPETASWTKSEGRERRGR